jgi:hypothetical protein
VVFLETTGERVENILKRLTIVDIGRRPKSSVRYCVGTLIAGCIRVPPWRIYTYTLFP